MQRPIYLDYASLTPPVPEALDAMRKAAEESWGQPGSLHSIGHRASYVLETARRQVADYLDATWPEIAFAASGRDALRLAMAQALDAVPKGATIVASRQDHPAMQELVNRAAMDGYAVHWLAMPGGAPNAEDLREIERASVIALSACNHELGTSVLDALAKAREDAIRVIDAVQTAPWVSLATLNDERTFYAISGAKLGAPMGVGVVRMPSRFFYESRAKNASLEGRSPPWLSAIGLGAACEVRRARRDELLAVARARADELLAGFRSLDANLIVNGAPEARLGTLLNVSFPGHYGKSLCAALSLEGVCISHTAACQASREDVSPVVRAAYPGEPERAALATRWSVSEQVTADDIRGALEAMKRLIARPRSAG